MGILKYLTETPRRSNRLPPASAGMGAAAALQLSQLLFVVIAVEPRAFIPV